MLLRTLAHVPGVDAGSPRVDVEEEDGLDRWDINLLVVNVKLYLLLEAFAAAL